ncbi:hypothetical protein [Undibacterium fentianense]|uniref:NadR/Ttd14 AAA domain-containing protein n=1 Tax=Undibacterium fentianense TaxID=2828728 RepID=A0A941IDS1_9BURK|nr:hypothetical protein [Undibacterium fentianense]MBR7798677.1 hypothetical protein [Undibacterium fentianense]
MSVQVTGASRLSQDHRMRLYPTKVINIIGGPGCDKSLFSSAIILNLNLRHKSVEQIPDYGKALVWQKNFDALKNQYQLAQKQYEMLDLLDGQVQYLVTECALMQVLYYNGTYHDNICDIAKTRQQILNWYHKHDNINILVERGDKKYVQTGRFQNEDEARQIDIELRDMLIREQIPFESLPPDIAAINHFARSLA